jgi:hypothetical protein
LELKKILIPTITLAYLFYFMYQSRSVESDPVPNPSPLSPLAVDRFRPLSRQKPFLTVENYFSSSSPPFVAQNHFSAALSISLLPDKAILAKTVISPHTNYIYIWMRTHFKKIMDDDISLIVDAAKN